jgi:hypothetical protein
VAVAELERGEHGGPDVVRHERVGERDETHRRNARRQVWDLLGWSSPPPLVLPMAGAWFASDCLIGGWCDDPPIPARGRCGDEIIQVARSVSSGARVDLS